MSVKLSILFESTFRIIELIIILASIHLNIAVHWKQRTTVSGINRVSNIGLTCA